MAFDIRTGLQAAQKQFEEKANEPETKPIQAVPETKLIQAEPETIPVLAEPEQKVILTER